MSSSAASGSVGEALDSTLDAIHRVRSRRVRRNALTGPSGERVTPTEGWLLTHLAEVGPLRMSALARWQDVDRSTMTTQVRQLERRGWVRREDDPDDGRAVLVVLEPAGRELVDHLRQVGSESVDRLIAHWPQEDRERLASLLTRLGEELAGVADRPSTVS